MSRKHDSTKYIGKKYGSILIESFAEKRKNRFYYNYKCDCGNIGKVELLHLKSGQSKCRHCYHGNNHPSWKGIGELSGAVFNIIKHSALSRNLDFSISIEYIWDLFLKQNKKCALTDLPLMFNTHDKNLSTRTASLDRIDNEMGYVEGNVQWVHKTINHIKCNLSNDYFIKLSNLICKIHPLNVDKMSFLEESKKYIKNIKIK